MTASRNAVLAFVEQASYPTDLKQEARSVLARLLGKDDQIELVLNPGQADVPFQPGDFVIAEGHYRDPVNGHPRLEVTEIVRIEVPFSQLQRNSKYARS